MTCKPLVFKVTSTDKFFEWPPYSPDISPIENLWAIMKRVHRFARHTTVDRIRHVWTQDDSVQESEPSLTQGVVSLSTEVLLISVIKL